MKKDELKEWQTTSAEYKIAGVLMMDKISFSYSEENGIIFSAPQFYVDKLIDRLIFSYGCKKRPVINCIND